MADNTPVSSLVADWLASGGQSGSSGSPKSEDTVHADDSDSPAEDRYDTEVMSENSIEETGLPQDEPTEGSQKSKQVAKTSNKPGKTETPGSTKETITVTDDKGRRQLEIDYSNKEQIKQVYAQAAGMRKFQAERDQAIQGRKAVETEHAQLKQDWTKLEEAFQGGPEALFDLLQGRKGAFDEHVQKKQQRSDFLKSATPQEIRALEDRERSDQQARELDTIRKENAKFKESIEQEREAMELRSAESKVFPVFDKYRFAGKLGSADDEQMFDEMLFDTAKNRLVKYEEAGVALTHELIEKEFRSVAQKMRGTINVQADKKVSRVMDQKKQESTENVQAKIKSGYRAGGGEAKEARDLIESGNLTQLLKGWGKYGNLFGKK